MRRLISLSLIAPAAGTVSDQAAERGRRYGRNAAVSGTNAETGQVAQDALNLALKEWNSRQNRYRYRGSDRQLIGKAEQTQKNLLTLLETKCRGRNHIVDAGCRRSNSVGRKFRRLHFTVLRQRTERRPVQIPPRSSYHTDKFTDNFRQAAGKLPASCSSNLYDALGLLIFAYENTPPDWDASSAERVSRRLHKYLRCFRFGDRYASRRTVPSFRLSRNSHEKTGFEILALAFPRVRPSKSAR